MPRCVGCPVSPNTGCDCVAAYAQDCAEAFDAFLAPHVLTVLTTDNVVSLEVACDGSYTCPCRSCGPLKAKRTAQNVKQPWELAA